MKPQWLEQERKRKYHKIAELFPLLEGPDYDELKADIAKNGLLEAIWLHPDGSIIDGRNRHRACIETETQPRFRTWSGQGSLVAFVVSLNLHRRHLTSSQRAVIALDVLPLLEREAKQRQVDLSGGNWQAAHSDTNYTENLGEIVTQGLGRSTEHAANLFNTNNRYVKDAKKLQRQAPDLLASVKIGEITIPQAKRELVKRQKKEAQPLPSNKYRVVYADPPWKYGNDGIIGETDHYGHTGRHYPSMTISELCEMGPKVKEMTERNAVLFLWVTSPLLEECFPVIRAWGFKYKTSFVWDKIKHNYGHYNSVRHELLLICTRGSCTPDNVQLFDSVQNIERSDTHSEKPEEFRAIIDTIYTHGKRIELFARKEIEGWDYWGNEDAGQHSAC